jgi:hypothetical protein
VVNTGCFRYRPPAQALLAQPLIPLEDAQPNDIPSTAITTLMPTLTGLIVTPPFALMFTTEPTAIGCGIAAAAFTAGFRRAGWHGPVPC